MPERNLVTGEETKNQPGSFVIEFCGTPVWQRFDKIIDPIGDFLTKSLGFDLKFKGAGLAWLADDFTEPRNTTEDILAIARKSIDHVTQYHNKGYQALLNGAVFEELGYIDFYKRTNVLTPSEAEVYTKLLLLSADRVDFVILILLSDQTVLNADPLLSLGREKGGLPANHFLKPLTTMPRRIMNPKSLELLNLSFLSVHETYGKLFSKISLIDLKKIKKDFASQEFGSALGEGLGKALARIYPIPPNIFHYNEFPRHYYQPPAPLIRDYQTPKALPEV